MARILVRNWRLNTCPPSRPRVCIRVTSVWGSTRRVLLPDFEHHMAEFNVGDIADRRDDDVVISVRSENLTSRCAGALAVSSA